MSSSVSVNNKGLFVKAYRGDATTLLAMNMAKENIKPNFVGFTIGFSFPDELNINYLYNRINFGNIAPVAVDAPEFEQQYTPSDKAPFQYFRWIHVPGTRFLNEQGQLKFGEYTYYVTPRFMGAGGLQPLDNNLTCTLKIEVAPFRDLQIDVSFTRGFASSQAFVQRFGRTKIHPDNLDGFDEKSKAGEKDGKSFTYSDMYDWLGFQARTRIFNLLEDVLNTPSMSIDVLAYDLNEPEITRNLLKIAEQGRMRMVLDNSIEKKQNAEPTGHGTPDSPETKFANKANQLKNDCVRRTRFSRYAHCKVFVIKRNGIPEKILTGSTNFSINGLYVNANHVVVINDSSIADLYSQVFDASWNNPANFSKSNLAKGFLPDDVAGADHISFAFSPHKDEVAKQILTSIADQVKTAQHSVLFSIMDLSTSKGDLVDVLKNIETSVPAKVFKYGVCERVKEVKLYKPGRKNAIIINAGSIRPDLPPPFDQEFNQTGIKIHHKFIVVDFDTPNAKLICGSSNLALGGEEQNGDNLLLIQDRELATVFAIEAIRLVDHYQFRAKRISSASQNRDIPHEIVLKSNAIEWTTKFYDPDDLKFVDRNLFCPI